ncbi:agamous-like MADS-box protein AGL104 [Canna indica]|uniref:Agamous-like MADS-box protein AGL104 n=1 Tax=Canna indica TaxID=4628 RepID=A0AAQ3L723_9LILI|nr:agamous-like MADS-box protein AGL104 [Canna indica]
MGRVKIEDVLQRYVDLPENDRRGVVQNREFLVRTLEKLKRENDMAAIAAYELQQEIARYQHRLQFSEQNLRYYEPDPLAFTSLSELESCEKFIMDALQRVTARKEYLLTNHMSSYDPSSSGMQMYLQPQQERMPNPYGNEMVQWVPDAASNPSHQIFVGADPLMDLREHGIYDGISQQNMGLQVDPRTAGCHVNGTQNEASWQQAYTSTELLSALIPSPPYPLIQQHPMGPTDLPTMVAQEQVDVATGCAHVSMEENGTTPTNTYDGNATSTNVS